MTCNIVLSFGSQDGGSLVVEGLVNTPSGRELFAAASDRLLAIVGGTGQTYDAKQGRVRVSARTLVISYR
jgi:hypothetical protein